MNDFTKEELQIIHLDMTAYIHRTTILAESPSHKNLRNKIESMIDNYYEIKTPAMDDYCCPTCNEEFYKCECMA